MRFRQGVSFCAVVVLSLFVLTSTSFAGDFYASCSGCTAGAGCTTADARSGTVVGSLGSIPGPFCHVTGTPFLSGSSPTALGGAVVSIDGDGSNNVVVSNMGSSGNDGAHFPLSSTNGYGLFAPGFPDLKTNGQVIKTVLKGTVNSVNNTVIGQYTTTGNGTAALLNADFSSLGAPNINVQLFRSNGTLIASYIVANNTTLTITGSFMDFHRSVTETVTAATLLMPTSTVGVLNFGFTNDVSVMAPAATNYTNVRTMVVYAQDQTATVGGVSSFDVLTANVSGGSMTITQGVLGGGVQTVIQAIPALSEAGMVVLTVLVLLLGTVLIMFRRPLMGSRENAQV